VRATDNRLGIIGAECSGKSTLADSLSGLLHGVVAGEVLREFVDREGRPPQAAEQADIMRDQRDREDQARRAHPGWVVIGDPAPLMTAVYSLAYFDDDTLVDEAVRLCADYDLVVWCDIDIPWVPDGLQHDGPDARRRVHEIIDVIVENHLIPHGVPVISASGGLDSRLGAVARAWQQRGLSAPT